MRTIAVVNQKGGCGKTITAINLAAFLAREGRRVLLVDMDPQGHASLGVLTDSAHPPRSMHDLFTADAGGRRARLADLVRPVRENLDLAPSDITLSAVPERLAGVAGRENVLAGALAEVRTRYDYVVIDCPPNVGLLTFNALKACSEAIVPMDPSFFSLHGIGKLLETFDLLAKETGHQIAARVLLTLYPGRTPFVKAVSDEVRSHLPGRYFETVIRYSVKLAEAASHGLPITRYAKGSAGYLDYQTLAGEVLAQEHEEAPVEPEPRVAVAVPSGSERPRAAAAPAPGPDGVVFTIDAPQAYEVYVAGDFNDWTPERTPMEPKGRIWRAVLPLPPGRYRYRYVVDGEWRSDPMNPLTVPSAYGGDDSLLLLGPSALTVSVEGLHGAA
jgi:chromosome partitioning protein